MICGKIEWVNATKVREYMIKSKWYRFKLKIQGNVSAFVFQISSKKRLLDVEEGAHWPERETGYGESDHYDAFSDHFD